MTPISNKADASAATARSGQRLDLAARVKARLRRLRAHVERRDTLLESVREANASRDAQRVAASLVRQAEDWLPAPCWAVIARDIHGQLAVFAEKGLTPDMSPALWAVADVVARDRAELFAADLGKELDAAHGGSGTVIAFPLLSRGETVGVLVGLDPAPSSTRPALGSMVLGLVRDLLEAPAAAIDNALALQRAEALSVTDDLTRLYNARYLNLVLRRETKRACRNGRPLSMLFLDLDGFKDVNDRYGHLSGSKALVEAGAIVRGGARETDIAARFGGDEFALVLPETGTEGAFNVAERLLERFRTHRFLADEGLSVPLTASIGVATLPDAAASAEELLRVADAAMYRVKALGKNGIQVAQE